jgi:predicted nuclease of predicted toxin-antitoxin system
MARLYSNENFPLPVVERLRELGHDVLTSFDAGNANQGILDPEVLTFAISQSRCLLTLNRKDFVRLHRENPVHSGMVVCREDTDFIRQAERIHAALPPDPANQLIRVNRPA